MKMYGLIGRSLDHSFSKDYFDKKFAENNIDAEYRNFEFEKIEDVRQNLEIIENLSGLNVTIPYKQEIIPYLDDIDAFAKEIGAVNTIQIKDGKWKGFNSDYYGFLTSLKPFLENKHDRALILGSGGASKAIQFGLKKMGIPFHIVSREKGKNDLCYEDLNKHVFNACKLIINTTPLGTFPNMNEIPKIPFEYINSNHLVYDLVYNPSKTQFLKIAEEQGALIMNGIDMLKHQAEKSWEIWNKKG
jgi:shikimate dehydrogenase